MNATTWTTSRLATLERWADHTAALIDQLRPNSHDGSGRVEKDNQLRLYARIVAAILWLRARRLQAQVDLWQGDTEIHGGHVKFDGRAFGYVHGAGGGLFFTWMDTLAATIKSIEEDEIDGDGGLDVDEVAEFLRGYLPTTKRGRKMWSAK